MSSPEVWLAAKILGRYQSATRHRVLSLFLTLLLRYCLPFASGVGLTMAVTGQYLAGLRPDQPDPAYGLVELRRGQAPERVDAFFDKPGSVPADASPLARQALQLLALLYKIPSEYKRGDFTAATAQCRKLGWERCDFDQLEIYYWMLP